ncbi:PREDICTED: uncharacterized protein LOC105453831 [Wasmannia auropunctata]|uniref:uncharacterized protein LOC105453831 n=1 Tax=Wasmannia auropunctata TaxID=64793 RepID=UPI0005F02A82|nr:PREDICTED: uncharacterized protein LOC105453831 [Wasmannia auropunctata]
MLSYIRDLIEQLNRALREVTFGKDRCHDGILRRLSPQREGPSVGDEEAITSSGIRRTTCSKDNDALTSSFYSDCLEDEILERREIESNSSSMDSAVSCRSKRTNLTYVIDSRTDVSCRDKLDGMRICDDELLSRESHMTFQTCCKESRHFIDGDKASVSLKRAIATCSSNVETSGGQAECETFRISRSCSEDGRRNGDTVIGKVQRNAVAGASRDHSSLDETEKRESDEESFVREAFSSSETVTI